MYYETRRGSKRGEGCRRRTRFEVQVDHLPEVEVVEALGNVGGNLSTSAENLGFSI